MKTVAIVQARMGSTRLPGKTLMDLEGKPLILRVIERSLASKNIDDLIVATTNKKSDDEFAQFLESNSIKVFRGNESDVLDRFYRAAELMNADTIVRITADDPLKDPDVIDLAIDLLNDGTNNLDYVSNTLVPTYPEGLDIEVFNFSSLKKAFEQAKLESEREHVTPFIWKNPHLFRVKNFGLDDDYSGLRWTVDYQEDLDFARLVFRHLNSKGPLFRMSDVLELLNRFPEIATVNSGKMRNEGYQKSLAKESNVPPKCSEI